MLEDLLCVADAVAVEVEETIVGRGRHRPAHELERVRETVTVGVRDRAARLQQALFTVIQQVAVGVWDVAAEVQIRAGSRPIALVGGILARIGAKLQTVAQAVAIGVPESGIGRRRSSELIDVRKAIAVRVDLGTGGTQALIQIVDGDVFADEVNVRGRGIELNLNGGRRLELPEEAIAGKGHARVCLDGELVLRLTAGRIGRGRREGQTQVTNIEPELQDAPRVDKRLEALDLCREVGRVRGGRASWRSGEQHIDDVARAQNVARLGLG